MLATLLRFGRMTDYPAQPRRMQLGSTGFRDCRLYEREWQSVDAYLQFEPVLHLRRKSPQVWGLERPRRIVVDSGTGATAVGLALGAALAGAPWTVHGVMLAGDRTYYEAQQRVLTAAFCSSFLPGEDALSHSFKEPV